MSQESRTFTQGFSLPAMDMQSVFREILKALSSPGTEVALRKPGDVPLLNAARMAALLTLTDSTTPLWLDELTQNNDDLHNYLAFHCGVPVVNEQRRAEFAVITAQEKRPALDTFSLGTDEYPDQSTTVIVQVDAFTGERFRCTGPGVKTERNFMVSGLDADFWEERKALMPLFPRGVDILLTCGHCLIALPRTSCVEEISRCM